ncbi:MAG: helix-hairpin-helix domain-containing protein [Acidobacteria bacterium]|nr:helix-hairpin-helix domain-containing protein [Acidobacteriota bacterium]
MQFSDMTIRFVAAAALLAAPLSAVVLPDGEGKAQTEKLCVQCHDIAKSVSLRQDRNGWGVTMTKMIAMGMKGSDEDMQAVLGYLAANFPPEALPPLNINTARAIQIESRFSLKRSEAAALLKYRKEHGPFKTLDDLKNVPGIDFAKIEAKSDGIVF